nr:cupin domain-containing protein [Rhizobium setariae]
MGASNIAFVADDPEFIAGRAEDVPLELAPINPSWITSGAPIARAGLHSPSIDGMTSTNIWECSAGSFWWTFYDEETVFILEGSVRITSQSGEVRTLKPGDIAYFAASTKAHWEIDDYVRKIAFCRRRHSPQVQALRSMLGRMKRGQIPKITRPSLLGTLAALLPL